jgi:hypothetical protein
MSVPAIETRIVVLARAPVAGTAKTRLIPLLGAHGAAALQEQLIEHTLATAIAANIGGVQLWCSPSAQDPTLAKLADRYDIDRVTQCEGDLGERMLHASQVTLATSSRMLMIGTDCPALTPANLQAAVNVLDGHDSVLIPAEDGGYVLLGLTRTDARLFSQIAWSNDQVLDTTRARLTQLNWRWRELPTLWDVDRPADFERLRASGLISQLNASHNDAEA